MDKISSIARFQERQNIILEGFDPVSAGGFTQLPNCVLNDPHLSPGGKVVYAKLLLSAKKGRLRWNGHMLVRKSPSQKPKLVRQLLQSQTANS